MDADADDACAGLSKDKKKARDANRVVTLRLILWRIFRGDFGEWVDVGGNNNDDDDDSERAMLISLNLVFISMNEMDFRWRFCFCR